MQYFKTITYYKYIIIMLLLLFNIVLNVYFISGRSEGESERLINKQQ